MIQRRASTGVGNFEHILETIARRYANQEDPLTPPGRQAIEIMRTLELLQGEIINMQINLDGFLP
jgi:hypothetical protein